MALNRVEYNVLSALEKEPGCLNQANRLSEINISQHGAETVISLLQDRGLLKENQLTPEGIQALEPYRAKRAVFLAAGFGSRLVPVTLNTPKPLIRVKGERMIDTLIDAVLAAGIEDIVIVRGYLGEQFDQLLYKYPQIRFVENPAYNESNNISSAMCVRYLLKNAYVMEADLVLRNPGLISKYQYSSNYLGVPVERTDDWCFQLENGIITKLSIGGINCVHMFGLSYWTETDGAKLAEHIKRVYEMPGGKERYWDQVALEYFINDYRIEIRKCSFNDIAEIDTYHDLKNMDHIYEVDYRKGERSGC